MLDRFTHLFAHFTFLARAAWPHYKRIRDRSSGPAKEAARGVGVECCVGVPGLCLLAKFGNYSNSHLAERK